MGFPQDRQKIPDCASEMAVTASFEGLTNVLIFILYDATGYKTSYGLSHLQPNDPYMGRSVLGSVPERRSICVSQLWTLLNRPVWNFFSGVCLFIYKFCIKINLVIYPEFCTLYRNLIQVPNG